MYTQFSLTYLPIPIVPGIFVTNNKNLNIYKSCGLLYLIMEPIKIQLLEFN